jgi:leader peptidase (prepilin peptidase)/N-methyltransferase
MDVLGLGDVKMVAMIGSFLGIGGTLLAAIVGSMAGSIIGVIYILVTRKDWHSYPLPFGSFLAAAAIFAALAGSQVFQWYNPLS